jgi:aminomethyltransferase
MKLTPLYDAHKKLGGKMVEFGGWNLPVMYTSIIDEHKSARTKAAIFDVSHMGEIKIEGPGSVHLLQKLIPTDINKLSEGRCMYSVLLNETGGVVDDLFIYKISDDSYFLVVNASTSQKDFNWISGRNSFGAAVTDISSATAKIDIQGPMSPDFISRVFSPELISSLTRFSFGYTEYSGCEVMISQTGYTGENGYEIYCPSGLAEKIWNELIDRCGGDGLVPAGLGSRDTLRLESCYSLYGHELSDSISPIEAGLKWLISSKENYTAADIIAKQMSSGAPREQICFRTEDGGRAIPRDGSAVKLNGVEIGVVTSGGFSPTFGCGIGMGLVKTGVVKPGEYVEIEIRGRLNKAEVVKRPFYKFAQGAVR